jgi:hypothetical protein
MSDVKSKIIIGAVAVYIGLFLRDFFNALTRDLVVPLLAPVSTVQDGITKIQFQIFGVKLNIGDVLAQTINLVIAGAVVYFMYPLLIDYVPVVGRR